MKLLTHSLLILLLALATLLVPTVAFADEYTPDAVDTSFTEAWIVAAGGTAFIIAVDAATYTPNTSSSGGVSSDPSMSADPQYQP